MKWYAHLIYLFCALATILLGALPVKKQTDSFNRVNRLLNAYAGPKVQESAQNLLADTERLNRDYPNEAIEALTKRSRDINEQVQSLKTRIKTMTVNEISQSLTVFKNQVNDKIRDETKSVLEAYLRTTEEIPSVLLPSDIKDDVTLRLCLADFILQIDGAYYGCVSDLVYDPFEIFLTGADQQYKMDSLVQLEVMCLGQNN